MKLVFEISKDVYGFDVTVFFDDDIPLLGFNHPEKSVCENFARGVLADAFNSLEK